MQHIKTDRVELGDYFKDVCGDLVLLTEIISHNRYKFKYITGIFDGATIGYYGDARYLNKAGNIFKEKGNERKQTDR